METEQDRVHQAWSAWERGRNEKEEDRMGGKEIGQVRRRNEDRTGTEGWVIRQMKRERGVEKRAG